MEVPRLGVESELQRPAYTTATATQDLSHVCDLHHSSWQRRILNPLNKAGMEPASLRILVSFLFCWATAGTPSGTSFEHRGWHQRLPVWPRGLTGLCMDCVEWEGGEENLAGWVNDAPGTKCMARGLCCSIWLGASFRRGMQKCALTLAALSG